MHDDIRSKCTAVSMLVFFRCVQFLCVISGRLRNRLMLFRVQFLAECLNGTPSFLGHRFDPFSGSCVPQFKNEPDDLICVNEREDCEEWEVQYHSGDPCCWNTDKEKTADFKYCTKDRLSSGAEAGIHNVITCPDCSGGKVD